MRTSITIRPAGMASAVTALAVATMLAACVASTGGPVPGPQEAPASSSSGRPSAPCPVRPW